MSREHDGLAGRSVEITDLDLEEFVVQECLGRGRIVAYLEHRRIVQYGTIEAVPGPETVFVTFASGYRVNPPRRRPAN